MGGEPARVRLGAFAEAWELMKPHLGAWAGAAAVTFAATLVVVFASAVFGVLNFTRAALQHETPRISVGASLALAVGLAAVQAVCAGGMVKMAVQQARGELIDFGDLFDATGAFGRLFAFFLALQLVSTGLSFLPHGSIIGPAAMALLLGFFLFAVPLMVDQEMGVINAVRTSATALGGQVPMAILFVLTLWVLAFVGLLACVAPALVSVPLAFSAIGVLYRDFFPPPAKS